MPLVGVIVERRASREPPNLAELRIWIARLLTNYERYLVEEKLSLSKREQKNLHKRLEALRQTYQGEPQGSGKDRLRELIASGVVTYGFDGSDASLEKVPEQLMVELVTFALWPVILAPKLPGSWFEDLQEISSPQLATLVTHARLSQTTGSRMSVQTFERAVSAVQFAGGLLKLFDDLNDPRRGGPALTAVVLADSGSVPPKHATPKAIVLWSLSAAAAGVIGNRADDALAAAWDWLIDNGTSNTASHGHSSSGSSADAGSSGGHHPNNNQSGEGLVRVVEDFFKSIF